MTGTPQVQTRDNTPMSIGDWIITMILLYIPIVGLICLLYWALSSTGNVNRRNFSIAALIISIVAMALVVIGLVFFGGMAAIMSEHGTQL